MSERRDHPSAEEPMEMDDRDVNARWIIQFGIWLALITGLSMFLMSLLFHGFQRMDEARDPPKPPLYQEMAGRLEKGPPGAQLQTSPEEEMATELAEESERLSSYGWVNKDHGIARIPIERAIDLVAAKGLPSRPAVPPAPPVASHPGDR